MSGAGGRLTFSDAQHPYGAVVGAASLTPTAVATGPDFRGPQDPAQTCPASGPGAPSAPDTCDDTAYGKGVGGSLDYAVHLIPGRSQTVWFVVAGSDTGIADAQQSYRAAAANPDGALAAKVGSRTELATRSKVSLPGDPLLEQSLAWSRQELADLHQHAEDLRVRVTNAGTRFPPPVGTVPAVDFEGAGYPDYPWLFATDGEYTAYALLATGQAGIAENHLRALRDVSNLADDRSGKIVHEVTTDGSVFFGADTDPGNTDESVKFPSTVALVWRCTGDNAFRDEMYDSAKRALDYVTANLLDAQGWPTGAGNVERTVRARPRSTTRSTSSAACSTWPTWLPAGVRRRRRRIPGPRRGAARPLRRRQVGRHEGAARRPRVRRLAAEPSRHAGLPALLDRPDAAGGRAPRGDARQHPQAGVAPANHAVATLDLHETPCYTGPYGLFHTGSGPGTVTPRPGCDGDRAISTAPDERDTFTLNSAVAAVAEGSYGRIGKALSYSDMEAALQLPAPGNDQAEMPGAMPERAGGDASSTAYYGSNLGHLLTERGMVMQAWGAYGTWWPVVHQLFGLRRTWGAGRRPSCRSCRCPSSA